MSAHCLDAFIGASCCHALERESCQLQAASFHVESFEGVVLAVLRGVFRVFPANGRCCDQQIGDKLFRGSRDDVAGQVRAPGRGVGIPFNLQHDDPS